MGKALRILTVFVLIFSIIAFVMGLKNFSKRELLIGRTHKLEEAVIALALTLEKSEPVAEGVANHTDWDIDQVTDRSLDNPEMSDFWSTYEDRLEAASTETFNLKPRREELSAYYAYEMVDGKYRVKKDFQNRPLTTGPKTMANLLDETIERAKSQYQLLNRTRTQLKAVAEKLDEVAEMLNSEKVERRRNLATIKERDETIVSLNNTISEKDAAISRANRQIEELKDNVNDLTQTVATKDQDIADKALEINHLKEEIQRLTLDHAASNTSRGGGSGKAEVISLAAGKKASIVHADNDSGYVVVKFSQEALDEIKSASGSFQDVEFMVVRTTADGSTYNVSRICVNNPPDANGKSIANIMYGWTQTPIQKGDDVVF